MSNTQKKNVPELRFPEFEGEYSLDIFGNLATNKSDKFNPQNENASIDIELDCIEQNTGRLIKIYNSKEFSSQKNKFNPQNVLYGKLRPYLNKYYFTKKSGVCSSEIWVLKSTKEDKLLNLFLYYFIQTKRYSDVASKSAGSKMPRADWGLIENIRVYFPELCEQQKIGQFFSKLDRQIELEEQKLELLQQQKKCYIQKIFSQELRFKDEEGNYYKGWNKKQLKDVLEFSNKRTINENEYPVLTSSRQGLILQSDYYKDRKTFAESNIGYFILPKNHITYRSRSDDGIFKFNLNLMIDVGIISKYYPVFKGIDANQYYLTLHLNYQLKKEYIKYATGTSQLVLSQKDLQNIKTKLPSYEEQQKIGGFFSEIDRLVEKQSSKVGRLKVRKKELLQKMFV
ncbi:restriction endonuclease subunit S [Staphylococcus aureus]|uniref:restriction endonuclease subunit S n=1 Tax=Staphylococcus aureus TaxID=1280 RepID=UPI000AE5B6ED|nr:restriction endonuclease subunit S [Staphylococcus aureus]MVW53722.1 restriction endonuclease subunit S [Staphylococcus aureus]NSL44830.1 restriction endonuclease subunit S [Staphylococcus aureus]PCF69528.1 restriction endonuclease subunit S [Staphylococcus aureus]THJ26887.1 restriction endonuclease subunit S [Staphylococcus aureus]